MDSQIAQSIQLLQAQAASLLLYQSVLKGDIGQAFLNVLQTLQQGDRLACLYAYGNWFSTLAAHQQSWQDYLLSEILRADNPFTRQVQQQDLTDLPSELLDAARSDLRILQSLYGCSASQISHWLQAATGRPKAPLFWSYSQPGSASISVSKSPMWLMLKSIPNWAEAVEELVNHYCWMGTGLFAEYWALRWHAGQLVGIAHPDPVRLDELIGYDLPKQLLKQNTEALLSGYRALHVLLYGSRGTGKSSLVKSLLHEYGDRGLRLIEVAKSDLKDLIAIVDQLRDLPQKFIVFVDDLSFEADEDTFKALKVVLEGNLTARPQNMVVYATSNRRHLIREFFGDRPRPSDADEVHAWDTVQEKLSFSDRFGLTLTFEPANQKTYLEIVHHLAKQTCLDIELQDLDHRALQWATRHNGRSGRTARQFIDFLQAELSQHPRQSISNE
jgi:predicted AAA+ superfamily ATPase